MDYTTNMEKDLLNTVKSCSRCGLCAQVCPIYNAKKTETALARGKFLQLLGVLRGELKFNKKIERNIKLCMNCKRCTRNCPSEIDAVELFSRIKYERAGSLERLLHGEFIFAAKLLPFKILNALFSKPLKLNEGELYFKGCLSRRKVGRGQADFKCCAVPFLTSGRRDIYEKYVQHNLEIIERPDVKKVFFDCATCFDEVKNYPFKNPENRAKLEILPMVPPDTLFTFFKPCHIDQGEFEKLEATFGSNYTPLEKHSCCGFGGDFFIRHPIIAHKLSAVLAKRIYDSGAKIVLTACPSCSWSLHWGLFWERFKNKHRIKVRAL